MSLFKKAVRSQAKLKLALAGPSGAGKTFSALRLARGLGGKKIAVLDTENGSASLYSDRFDFDVINVTPPFTTERYEAAIQDAVENKYDVLILDSISHAWNGEGGLLQQKEQIDSRGKGNSYTNWAAITKKDEHFRSAMLHAPIHIIATMRSKQDYIQTEENGRKVVKKVGMAPVQRDGIEYEFTVMLDVAMNHEAEASKDRTGLFPTGKYFKITEQTGEQLAKWLSEVPPPPEPPTTTGKSDSGKVSSTTAVETIKAEAKALDAKAIGEYTVKWAPHKDRALKDVPIDWIKKTLERALDQQAEGKDIGEIGEEFVEHAMAFIGVEKEPKHEVPF